MIDLLEKTQIEQGIYKVTVLQETESTNTLVKELARSGEPAGTVVIAGSQSGGRGRLGRSFFSPEDTGIYMSILLRPAISPERVVMLTTMAAVAVCEAIENVCGFEAGICGIKWVNDIFVEGRKVCGILTESSFSTDKEGRPVTEFCVVGIGINCYEPEGGFPEEIRNTAGALLGERQEGFRNRLCREILERFDMYYGEESLGTHFEKYRERSIVLGREVEVISLADGTKKCAKAVDIDYDCRLIVRYPDGKTEVLSTGDVSVKSFTK